MDYTNDISIDSNSLDIEWMKLPANYFKYAELEAKAKEQVNSLSTEKDKLNALIKRKHGELALAVRENPALFGITKATENTVEEAVLTHIEYTSMVDSYYELLSQLNTATYNLDMMANAKWALEMKKKALDGLTQLWSSNYFMQSSDNKALREQASASITQTVQVGLDNKLKSRRVALG